MSRRLDQRVAATHGALVEGERVVASGVCWAARLRRAPLLFLGRKRYLLILTNRRVLLFGRRGRHLPRPNDPVIGKQYAWFELGRVRTARPLMQVQVTTGGGARMVFEFPPRRRELGRTLAGRLRDGAPAEDAPPAPTSDPARHDESAFWGPSTRS
jgi:hypothetical protein